MPVVCFGRLQPAFCLLVEIILHQNVTQCKYKITPKRNFDALHNKVIILSCFIVQSVTQKRNFYITPKNNLKITLKSNIIYYNFRKVVLLYGKTRK